MRRTAQSDTPKTVRNVRAAEGHQVFVLTVTSVQRAPRAGCRCCEIARCCENCPPAVRRATARKRASNAFAKLPNRRTRSRPLADSRVDAQTPPADAPICSLSIQERLAPRPFAAPRWPFLPIRHCRPTTPIRRFGAPSRSSARARCTPALQNPSWFRFRRSITSDEQPSAVRMVWSAASSVRAPPW
jgi:hypothetical protein